MLSKFFLLHAAIWNLFFCVDVVLGYRQVNSHALRKNAAASNISSDSADGAPSSDSADGAEDFIRAFKLAFRAANTELPSKDGKRVIDERSGNRKITIKQWAHVNAALKPARDAFIPSDYGESLIDNVFAEKIRKKFDVTGSTGASRSGSKIFVSEFDEHTSSGFLLKSEDRDEIMTGMLPILDSYAERIRPTNACRQSTMMKVLLIFEPLDVDSKVNNKVWTLLTNINPFPPRGNEVREFDLKHSRETDRCAVPAGESVGYLGDFLHAFGKPLRDFVAEQYKRPNPIYREEQNVCLMKSIGSDLAAIDSAYPSVKLVDQSLLIFAVRPKDDQPSQQELLMASSRNNVLTVLRGNQTWFLVVGMIDLFANKQGGKRLQSYKTGAGKYVMGQKKFSLYPVNLFCMSSFFLYYREFSPEGALVTTDAAKGGIGASWGDCYGKGDESEVRFQTNQLSKRSTTRALHKALGESTQFCSVLQTCDELLSSQTVRENLYGCCASGAAADDASDGDSSCSL